MNELIKRGHEGVGSDIQEQYSGVEDGSEVTKASYLSLDITDKEAVECAIGEVKPDAVIHCAAWTAVDMAEDDDKVAKVRAIKRAAHRILRMSARSWTQDDLHQHRLCI